MLAHVSNAGGDHCPLAIYNALKLRDADISVRIKPISGREDQAGGVVFRYRDPKNYYLARENALTQNVAIFKVENGQSRQITSPYRTISHPTPGIFSRFPCAATAFRST